MNTAQILLLSITIASLFVRLAAVEVVFAGDYNDPARNFALNYYKGISLPVLVAK
jgi:hypothetical protein